MGYKPIKANSSSFYQFLCLKMRSAEHLESDLETTIKLFKAFDEETGTDQAYSLKTNLDKYKQGAEKGLELMYALDDIIGDTPMINKIMGLDHYPSNSREDVLSLQEMGKATYININIPFVKTPFYDNMKKKAQELIIKNSDFFNNCVNIRVLEFENIEKASPEFIATEVHDYAWELLMESPQRKAAAHIIKNVMGAMLHIDEFYGNVDTVRKDLAMMCHTYLEKSDFSRKKTEKFREDLKQYL